MHCHCLKQSEYQKTAVLKSPAATTIFSALSNTSKGLLKTPFSNFLQMRIYLIHNSVKKIGLKSQITNFKKTNKSQFSKSQFSNGFEFKFLAFGIYLRFAFLIFVILKLPITDNYNLYNQSNLNSSFHLSSFFHAGCSLLSNRKWPMTK